MTSTWQAYEPEPLRRWAGRTDCCPNGHPWTAETKYVWDGDVRNVRCRICRSGPEWPKGRPRKTHCPQGHEYTPENTYIRPKSGDRSCLTCRKAQADERRAAAKGGRA